jgi:hypothetical protein
MEMSDLAMKAGYGNQTVLVDSGFLNSEKYGTCKVSTIEKSFKYIMQLYFLLFAVLVDNNDNEILDKKENLFMPCPIRTENLHVQLTKNLKSYLRYFSRLQATLAIQSSSKRDDISERFRKLLIEPRSNRCFIYIWEPFFIVVRGTRARIEIILFVEQPLASPVQQPQPQQKPSGSSPEMGNPDFQSLGKHDTCKDSIILSSEPLTLPNLQPEPQQQPSSSSPKMDVKTVSPKTGIL